MDAGGIFESGGYDGVINSCCQNPLSGRLAWSGKSGVNQTPEFITTKVKLPAARRAKKSNFAGASALMPELRAKGSLLMMSLLRTVLSAPVKQTIKAPRRLILTATVKRISAFFARMMTQTRRIFIVQNSSNNLQIETAWGSSGDLRSTPITTATGKPITRFFARRAEFGLFCEVRTTR